MKPTAILFACAVTCFIASALASLLHGHGFDGLALLAVLFYMLAGAVGAWGQHKTKETKR